VAPVPCRQSRAGRDLNGATVNIRFGPGYEFQPSLELAPFLFFVFLVVFVSSVGRIWIRSRIRDAFPSLDLPAKDEYVRFALDANDRLTLILSLFTATPYALWRVYQNNLPDVVGLGVVTGFSAITLFVIFYLVLLPVPRMEEPLEWRTGRYISSRLRRHHLSLVLTVILQAGLFFLSGVKLTDTA
jgi:hypothetical protein